ncbi:Uma2 family endonuclease [Fodinicola acaciae]|uniref:Uma2 family endonuclease n=1 Tax=Fodinicola acaciae TaxID=2681555 RepID=UPI0013D028D3|nr:Uma2 family endonuclease [Fodinicola acaciae]
MVGDALKARRPGDVYVLHGVAVRDETDFHDNGYDATGVLLAVEVASRSSVTMDRTAKPAIYAECGIQWYWRVDRDYTVHCFRLEDGAYVPIAKAGRGERIELDEPWPVSFAADDLVLPRLR